jgi:hypothetical protein
MRSSRRQTASVGPRWQCHDSWLTTRKSGQDGAGAAAAHGDQHLGRFKHVRHPAFGLFGRYVDAPLGHRRDGSGIHRSGGFGSTGADGGLFSGKVFEESHGHLGSARVVSAENEHSGFGHASPVVGVSGPACDDGWVYRSRSSAAMGPRDDTVAANRPSCVCRRFVCDNSPKLGDAHLSARGSRVSETSDRSATPVLVTAARARTTGFRSRTSTASR